MREGTCCTARNFVTDFSVCLSSIETRFLTLVLNRRRADGTANRADAHSGTAVSAMITVVVVKMDSAPRPLLANRCGGGRRSWVR